MKVLITGATGFIGKRLVHTLLKEGHSIVILSRSVGDAQRKFGTVVTCYPWDPMHETPPAEAFDAVDGIIHLAGEGIANRRWSAAQKEKILKSRVLGTRHLVQTINGLIRRPKVVVFSSAIGIYGDRGDERLTEQSPDGKGFLAEVCQAWEKESTNLAAEIRRVNVRTGIVLGTEGGALTKLLPIFRLGVGGPVGSGKQYMSWIHLDDIVGLFVHALTTEKAQGPLNGVAPEAVTNKEFSRALGQALKRPAVLPAPAIALKIAMGEMSELVLASQRVVPEVAQATDYHFQFPTLPNALADIVKKKDS